MVEGGFSRQERNKKCAKPIEIDIKGCAGGFSPKRNSKYCFLEVHKSFGWRVQDQDNRNIPISGEGSRTGIIETFLLYFQNDMWKRKNKALIFVFIARNPCLLQARRWRLWFLNYDSDDLFIASLTKVNLKYENYQLIFILHC